MDRVPDVDIHKSRKMKNVKRAAASLSIYWSTSSQILEPLNPEDQLTFTMVAVVKQFRRKNAPHLITQRPRDAPEIFKTPRQNKIHELHK